MNMRIDVSGVRSSCETADRNSFCTPASAAPRVTKIVPTVYPVSAVAQNASTRMPPTSDADFEPPVATSTMPIAVMSTVGSSAVRTKIRRARCSRRVVGERAVFTRSF